MRKVIKYCEPGRLTELEINLNNREKLELDEDLLTQAHPYFRRLEKFSLLCSKVDDQSRAIFDFYKQSCGSLLKSLTLQNISFESLMWSRILTSELMNIREICFYGVELSKFRIEIRQLLHHLPNLEAFVYLPLKGRDVLTNFETETQLIAPDLLEYSPNLKCLEYFLNVDWNSENSLKTERFEFLKGFRHLSKLHLKSDYECYDLQNIFQFIPNIKKFGISSLKLARPSVQCRHIFKALRKIVNDRRAQGSPNEFVEIIVDEFKYREFKTIKNIEKFAILSIKNR